MNRLVHADEPVSPSVSFALRYGINFRCTSALKKCRQTAFFTHLLYIARLSRLFYSHYRNFSLIICIIYGKLLILPIISDLKKALSNSSIGRKVVMSVTGIALVLFLTFHMAMNLVALFSAEGYNMVCEFLGTNWYALLGTLALAALFVIHIIYAFWLTMMNRAARGNERYAVSAKPKTVEWASQNMLALGIIVILGLALHLFNFWYNMMFAELIGNPMMGGLSATDGYGYIMETFSNPVFFVLYIVWLCALWFHLTHGFWSAMQTLGWNNTIWINRWKCISNIYSTIIVLGFMLVAVVFFVKNL